MNTKGKESTRGSIQTLRETHHKKIRRQQIDNAFKQKRSVLVTFNRMQEQQTRQNTASNYNFYANCPPQPQIMYPGYFYHPLQHLQPFQGYWGYQRPILHTNRQKIPEMNQEIVKPTKNVCQQIVVPVLARGKGFVVYDKILGKGTYSTVYEGQQIVTKIKVAVKQVKQLEQNQIKTLSEVSSQYIVKMLTYWKERRKTYIVLELCDRNLRQQLKNCSKSDAIKYFTQVLEGMSVLVEKKIIHRDLKFENILIKGGVAKITDFGLARSLGDQLQVQSVRCGTPYTMAPQILLHTNHYKKPSYTNKCDIWSLGILLHEILYDRHPFDYQKTLIARQRMVKVNRKYPTLDLFIDKALVFDERKRMNWKEVNDLYYQIKTLGKNERDFRIQPVRNLQEPQQKLSVEQSKVLNKNQQPNVPINYWGDSKIPKHFDNKQQQLGKLKAAYCQHRQAQQICPIKVNLIKPKEERNRHFADFARGKWPREAVQESKENSILPVKEKAIKNSKVYIKNKFQHNITEKMLVSQMESHPIKIYESSQKGWKHIRFFPFQLLLLAGLLIIYNVLL